MLPRITSLLISCSCVFFLCSCSTALYIADAGVGQWKLMNRARPVKEVLESPYTTEQTKAAIRTVEEVKGFASKELGLKATKNYTQFVKLDGDYVSWAVSASHPLKLEEKKWKFPIVGELPYIGFFQKEKAERFAKKTKEESAEENLDTWVRGVPAFSSLGWFSDPLYSSMIHGKEKDIADLVIHESLHATVWIGDNVDFNEKLANFVGLEGSIAYLQSKKLGANAIHEARAEVAGEKIFAEFIKQSIEQYKSTIEVLAEKDPAKTLEAKKAFYASMFTSYEDFFTRKKNSLQNLEAKKMPAKFENWNNATLLTYANYYADFSVFEAMLRECAGSLPRFVRWVVSENAKGHLNDAPEQVLSDLVKSRVSCEL